MTDTEVVNSGNTVPVASKKSKSKAKKSKNALTHPKISEMVIEAITELKERNGSSLQAIKKYVGANFKAEVEKLSPFIKKYLKTAVIKGVLIQTRGHGATGSFKLSITQTSPDKSRSRDETRKSRIIPVVIKKAPKPKKVAKKTKAKVEKKIKTAKTPKKLKAKPTPKSSKVKKGKASKAKKSKK